MRKIITFLGRRPQETRYLFNGQIYTGQVFAEALRQFVEYDQMLVCVTPEAHQDAWPVLENLSDPRIQPVSIPRGETTAEMWEMFDAITSRVDKNETVVFDITHGLRSLPFLVFLFAAYLKTAKSVTIQAVYYGALELGDPKAGKPAPVIDLSEFVGMLDWLTAADRFIRFGDSKDLAELVHTTGKYSPEEPLAMAAQKLEALSQALRLIRPGDAMRHSAELPEALEAAHPLSTRVPSLRPYSLLLEELKQAYLPFALQNPFDPSQIEASLARQRDLIHWYIDHQQWVQAVSLGREWLITWVMYQLGETDFLNQPLRESVADTLSKESHRRKEANEQKLPFNSLFLRSIPQISDVLGNWLSLAGVRNDIDHAGMRQNARQASELVKSLKSLCKKLHNLPLQPSSVNTEK